MKLIIMVGLPASGKSTLAKKYAEEFDCELIQYDAIHNPDVPRTIMAMLKTDMEEGKDVIIDGVYVTKKSRAPLVELARSYGAEINFYMVDTSMEDCLANNEEREHPINEHFIKFASALYEEPTEDEYDTLIRSEEK